MGRGRADDCSPARILEHLAQRMRALFTSTAALILALGLPAADAFAASSRSSSLGWVRGAGAEGCLGTRALAEAVEARLGRQVFVSAARAEVAIEGQIERGPAGAWRASIALAGEGGRVLGTRELLREAASCRELDEQLVLVIAVMIDPDAALHAAPVLLAAPAPTAPAPIAPRELPPLSLAAPPRPEPFRAGLHLGAVFALGLLPRPGVGLALRGRLTPPRWPTIELGGALWSANQAESGGVGARFTLAEGFVAACTPAVTALGFELGGCLGLRGGVLRAGGFGFDLAQSPERPTFAASLEGRVRRRIAGPLVLAVGPGLLAPFVRDRFFYRVDAGPKLEVFRMSPLVGTLEATLGFEFP
jgi:hypothetical protein